MKRYFANKYTQWIVDDETTIVRSIGQSEWKKGDSTLDDLNQAKSVQETDANWQPLAKPEPVDDGGQAFPSASDNFNIEGMSLRMWLAAKMAEGLLANSGGPIQANGMNGWNFVNCEASDVATVAFSLADALIAKGKAKP